MTDVTAKASPNYNEAIINDIVSAYTASPVRSTVDALAAKHGKTSRSVIAKLSALGVYVKPAPVTKRGEPVVKKEVFVEAIEKALGVTVPSLEKVTKADLQTIMAALQN